MNLDMQSIITLISITGCIGGFVFGVVNISRGKEKDTAENGQKNGIILTELGYIKAGIDDIKRRQEEMEKNYVNIVARLTAVEASAVQAHNRLDEYMGNRAVVK